VARPSGKNVARITDTPEYKGVHLVHLISSVIVSRYILPVEQD